MSQAGGENFEEPAKATRFSVEEGWMDGVTSQR